jgi:hypothetical protein
MRTRGIETESNRALLCAYIRPPDLRSWYLLSKNNHIGLLATLFAFESAQLSI